MCISFTDFKSNIIHFNSKNTQPPTKVVIMHTQYFDSTLSLSNGHKIFKHLSFSNIFSHLTTTLYHINPFFIHYA